MTPQTVIGIDPGLTGAIAAVDADTGALLHVSDMPVYDGCVDAIAVAELLEAENVAAVWLEVAQTRPGQGAPGVLRMGRNYGVLIGTIGALRLPLHHVTAAVWKRRIGVGADKETSLRRARELWPLHAHEFARKRDDGRAEAALIAVYGLAAWRGGEVAA